MNVDVDKYIGPLLQLREDLWGEDELGGFGDELNTLLCEWISDEEYEGEYKVREVDGALIAM